MKYIVLLFFLLNGMLHAAIEVDVDYLRKALQHDRTNVPYRIILAKYYIQEGDYLHAARYLSEAKRLAPDNQPAQRLQKQLQRLTALQRTLPGIRLNNPFALEKALLHYTQKGQCQKFLDIYHQIEAANLPLTQNSKLDAALCYAKTGAFKQARLLLKHNDFPVSDKLLSLKSMLALSQNDLQKANLYLARLQKSYPHSDQIPYLKQKVQAFTETRASQIRKKAFTGNSLQALQEYTYLLSKANRNEEAITATEQFVRQHPTNTEAKILLAKLYYWNGKLDKAFHTLYPIRLTSFETKKLYANILYERHDYKHALYYLPTLAEKEPDPDQRYNLLKRTAFSYAYLKQEEKAKRRFKELLKKHPQDKEIRTFQAQYRNELLLQKAIKAYREKHFDQALSHYITYYQENQDPKIAKEIAEIYYFQKRYQEAFPWFRRYLAHTPSDILVRFHYASALEKEKRYKEAIPHLQSVIRESEGELHYLAQYHLAYALMQLQTDEAWLQARGSLSKLSAELAQTPKNSYPDLKKFVLSLRKKAMGPLQKPTYYKDIVLTAGAKKDLNTETVFSDVKFSATTRPTLKTLLHVNSEKSPKPTLSLTMDYANDSQTDYRNYQVKVANLMAINGIRYSAVAQRYDFRFDREDAQHGKGFFLEAGTKTLTFSIGVESFKKFNTLVPKIHWAPIFGIHTLDMELSYRNGIFGNYRACMLKNQTDMLHFGLYDRILMDNLDYTELGFTVNHYEDKNTNIYASLDLPIWSASFLGLGHTLSFNENIDYNTKTDVCYTPTRLYDSTYLKYSPKISFQEGSLEATIGGGYSFENREALSSYGLKGSYTINRLATFDINCEQQQSSFTTDKIQYCTFNITQGW